MPSEKLTSSIPKYLQQEEILNRESIETISTLPKEKGWLTSNLYQYQGFWYPVRHLQGVISCQNQFQAEDSDVLLVTTPKSGTTWLKVVLYALVNRSRFPIAKNHPLLNQNPHTLVPFLEIKLYVDNQVSDFSSFPDPRILATHLPCVSLPETVKKSKCKLVYLCRNPKDIFVSLWKFADKLKEQDNAEANLMAEVFDKFCRGVSLFGPVWEHIVQYWNLSRENPDRVMFLKYEEMKEQPGVHLRRLAEFLGCPFSPGEEESGVVNKIQEMCSFDSLSSLEINRNGNLSSGEENKAFFRRGEVGDWKNYLNNEMAERMDRITEEKFNGLGLAL